jgi:hypothetical protein
MTQATVENTPVSIQLNEGESTTVPNGETWRVTLCMGHSGTNADNNTKVDINSTTVMGTRQDNSTGYGHTSGDVMETVLTAGDSISCSGGLNGGVHIGGFVVA